MNYALFVSRGDPIGQWQAEPQNILFWQRASCNLVAEGYSADVLHDQEVAAVPGLKIVYGCNVGMVKSAKEFSLSAEPGSDVLILKDTWWKHFDCYFAAQVQVLGVIYLAHATCANFSCQAVSPECFLRGCVLNGCDESITLSRQCLHVTRGSGIVAQCRPDFPDAQINSVFKVDEGLLSPKLLL